MAARVAAQHVTGVARPRAGRRSAGRTGARACHSASATACTMNPASGLGQRAASPGTRSSRPRRAARPPATRERAPRRRGSRGRSASPRPLGRGPPPSARTRAASSTGNLVPATGTIRVVGAVHASRQPGLVGAPLRHPVVGAHGQRDVGGTGLGEVGSLTHAPTLRPAHTPALTHEHPHRRGAGPDRAVRPAARRPAARDAGSPRRSSRTRPATPRCAGCTATPAPTAASGCPCRAPAWGSPSLSIYVTELFAEYDVRTVVRVGSCGALTEDLALRDLVIASRCVHRLVDEPDPVRGPRLRTGRRLRAAPRRATTRHRARPRRGHQGRADPVQRLLLQPAARAHRSGWPSTACWRSRWRPARSTRSRRSTGGALAVCTVSDHIVTGEQTTAQERQETFADMVDIALDAMLPRRAARRRRADPLIAAVRVVSRGLLASASGRVRPARPPSVGRSLVTWTPAALAQVPVADTVCAWAGASVIAPFRTVPDDGGPPGPSGMPATGGQPPTRSPERT